MLTFIPISMFDRSANGTSLVTSSHSRIAKLHMSADRRLISSGFFCRATGHKNQPVWAKSTDGGTQGGPLPPRATMPSPRYRGSLDIFMLTNRIMCPILLLHKRKPSADYVCFCNCLDFWASITERLQLPLWICAVWLMPTLGGHPCGRVHPAGTLEGEFDVRHADPGCHVFIYLWAEVTMLWWSSVLSNLCMLWAVLVLTITLLLLR